MDALALPAVAAALAWSTQYAIVPRIPEPTADEWTPGWTKPTYAGLASPRDQTAAGLLGLLGGASALACPPWQVPVMVVLAGPVASLALVDARTTYLPVSLTRLCQLLAVVAMIAGLTLSSPPGPLAIRWAVAATATWLVFWLMWRLTRSLGYGDVRLAPLLALGPAAGSLESWTWFLVLGTGIAAAWGLATQLWRRSRPSPLGTIFPYAPGLVLGCWLAVALS